MLEILAKNEKPPFYQAAEHTFPISDSVALKIYSNTDPKNMKIANLQKGLIFQSNGIDVIGEGIGFGVPIVKYLEETVFSGSSNLYVRKFGVTVEIRKEFQMDLRSRDRFRSFKLTIPGVQKMSDFFCLQYQKRRRLVRPVLIVRSLFFKFGVRSSFVKSPNRGTVTATYTLDGNRIRVKLDFSQLEQTNLVKVFILNEQGAHFFRTYGDSDGLRLVDEEIGAWDNVTAHSARITSEQNEMGFSLESKKGCVLRRGRELMEGSLNWIGLDYELAPECCNFEYEIELFGA